MFDFLVVLQLKSLRLELNHQPIPVPLTRQSRRPPRENPKCPGKNVRLIRPLQMNDSPDGSRENFLRSSVSTAPRVAKKRGCAIIARWHRGAGRNLRGEFRIERLGN